MVRIAYNIWAVTEMSAYTPVDRTYTEVDVLVLCILIVLYKVYLFHNVILSNRLFPPRLEFLCAIYCRFDATAPPLTKGKRLSRRLTIPDRRALRIALSRALTGCGLLRLSLRRLPPHPGDIHQNRTDDHLRSRNEGTAFASRTFNKIIFVGFAYTPRRMSDLLVGLFSQEGLSLHYR